MTPDELRAIIRTARTVVRLSTERVNAKSLAIVALADALREYAPRCAAFVRGEHHLDAYDCGRVATHYTLGRHACDKHAGQECVPLRYADVLRALEET